MDHADLITALGDYREVSRRLNRAESTVAHWKRRGIPPIEWGRLLEIAAEKGITTSFADLRAGARQKSYRADAT